MSAQDLSVSMDASGLDFEVVKANVREEYPIFRFGGDLATLIQRLEVGDAGQKARAKALKDAGETREAHTLYAGESLVGEFIGTVPMFSLEPKENWEETVVEGKKVWLNQHYLFKNPKTGDLFGLHDARASLWILEKISTSMTNPSIPNPVVKIDYVGIVEGKDVLEKEYGIKLKTGKEAHVAKVLTQKGTQIDTYASGAVNLTRDPRPNFGSAEKVDRMTQNARNFERAKGIHGAQPVIAGGQPQQLSM